MRGNEVGVEMKIYFAKGWREEEKIEVLDGNDYTKNHPKYVKEADVLIFKLNEGVVSKGILNEINAAQEAGMPVYLWKGGKLTDDPVVLSKLKLRKWKRKFKGVKHPFGGEEK